MNKFDKDILNRLDNNISFKEFAIINLKNQIKEMQKELKQLKKTKDTFIKTGILEF